MKISRHPVILGFSLFVLGIISGFLLSTPSNPKGEILGINHVAIRTSDFEKTKTYYQEVMGFPLAFEFKDEQGNPLFAYLQVSQRTFLEIMPTREGQAPGLDHFGLETSHTEDLIAWLNDHGTDASGPATSPRTGTKIGLCRDPDNNLIELIDPQPGSAHQEAIDHPKKH